MPLCPPCSYAPELDGQRNSTVHFIVQSSNFSAKCCQQIVTEKNEPCFVQGKYPCVNKEKLMLPNSFCHTVTCSNLDDVPELNFSYHN